MSQSKKLKLFLAVHGLCIFIYILIFLIPALYSLAQLKIKTVYGSSGLESGIILLFIPAIILTILFSGPYSGAWHKFKMGLFFF